MRIRYTHPAKLRFENSFNKKTLKRAWRLLFLSKGIRYALPAKLRFENSFNKKTLKRAWRFFL